MLLKLAARMLLHDRGKYMGALLGVALAVYLIQLQAGFYFGFRRDITKVIDLFHADIWLTPRCLPTFDYAVPMDDLACWKAQSCPGVSAAARVVFTFALWRKPSTGEKESLQLLGADFAAGVPIDLGRPVEQPGVLLAGPGNVLVDERDLDRLGLEREIPATGLEIQGRRAEVAGFLRDKHLFSTSCLVVTDLDNGRRFTRIPEGSCHFVAIRLSPGVDPVQAASELAAAIPECSVHRTADLRALTTRYWESQTGVGPVLLLSAALALIVGLISVLSTFYVITLERAPIIAAMKAMGAYTREIAAVLVAQVLLVLALGSLLAAGALQITLLALARTRISVAIEPWLYTSVHALVSVLSLAAALISLQRLSRIEPGEAFRT